MLQIKRVYDPPSPDDGERILVDRLWPRGLRRAAARIDLWHKELAPSDSLRRWFHADASRWSDFRRRYRRELNRHDQVIGDLQRTSAKRTVTFLYAARNTERNHAVVLRDFVTGFRRSGARRASHHE
ncbi:MAG TPA: DUF488 family protein [Candidatus Polarisedimenticolia bacterium]